MHGNRDAEKHFYIEERVQKGFGALISIVIVHTALFESSVMPNPTSMSRFHLTY